MGVVNMLKGLIRWAVVGAFSDDDKDFPIHQVKYMGKVSDAVAWYPFGYHANPGKDALSIMISMGSNPENKVILPGSPKERLGSELPTPLEKGEVLIFHPESEAFVHFTKDGVIKMKADKLDLIGDTKMSGSSAQFVFAGSNFNFIGITVSIQGLASIKLIGNTIIEGRDFLDHTHSDVQTGVGNTGGVN